MKKAFILLILILTSQIYGQSVYSLEKCISTALENNLSLQSSSINVQNAKINEKLSVHQRYPNLNGNTGVGLNLGRTIDPTSNEFNNNAFFSNNFSISSNILLYNGGRLKNGIEQSKLNVESNKLTKDQIERNIILEVCTAYLNVLFAQENITLAESRKQQTEQRLDQVLKLINAGSRPENERFSIDAQIATDDQTLIQNRNTYDLAILRLMQAMNLPVNNTISIEKVTDLESLTDPLTIELTSLLERGAANQPILKAREINVKASAVGEKIAKSAFYPTIGFGGQLGTNYSNQGKSIERFDKTLVEQRVLLNNQPVTFGIEQEVPVFQNTPYFNQFNNNLSYGFGLNVSIPILSNYQNKAGVERAKLQTEQAKIDYNNEFQLLNQQIIQAYADAKSAKANLEAAQKSVVAAQKSYEVTLKRYDAGATNNFDLLQQKNLFDQAENSKINAKYNYIFRTKVLDFYLGNKIKLN